MGSRLLPTWTIRLFAIWAFILAVIPLANLLLFTAAVEFYSDQYDNRAQVWIIFLLQSVFGTTFAFSAYGLWRYKNWGRLLFLWASSIWFSLNLVALIVPELIRFSIRQYTTSELVWNAVRFIVALSIPLWYLTRPHVKAIFDHRPSNNLSTEELTPNDNLN